jgi:hypothetical protein
MVAGAEAHRGLDHDDDRHIPRRGDDDVADAQGAQVFLRLRGPVLVGDVDRFE